MEAHRKNLMKEIINTEEDYVSDLENIVNVFIFPFQILKVLSSREHYSIFSNIEMLALIHSKVKTLMQEDIIQGLKLLSNNLGAYEVYCSTVDVNNITEVRKRCPEFNKVLPIAESDVRSRGLCLRSHLIRPFGRVCKYPLLLRDLIKSTPEDHSTYKLLQRISDKFTVAIARINEIQRRRETINRHKELQKVMVGHTVDISTQSFILECNLKPSSHQVNTLVLCKAIMILCETRNLQCHCVYELTLKDCVIISIGTDEPFVVEYIPTAERYTLECAPHLQTTIADAIANARD